jgi:hypothetical protein
MGAQDNSGWEGRDEAEDLPVPFQDLFVQYLQLLGSWRYELTGIG